MPAIAMKPRKQTTPEERIVARVVKVLRARESGKRNYGRADAHWEKLLAQVMGSCAECGGPVLKVKKVKLPNGKTAKITDLYAEKTKVFRSHGIPRYEIEVSDTEVE